MYAALQTFGLIFHRGNERCWLTCGASCPMSLCTQSQVMRGRWPGIALIRATCTSWPLVQCTWVYLWLHLSAEFAPCLCSACEMPFVSAMVLLTIAPRPRTHPLSGPTLGVKPQDCLLVCTSCLIKRDVCACQLMAAARSLYVDTRQDTLLFELLDWPVKGN